MNFVADERLLYVELGILADALTYTTKLLKGDLLIKTDWLDKQ